MPRRTGESQTGSSPIAQTATHEPKKKEAMQEQNRRKTSKLLFQKTRGILA
jgi:hypothetical protein